MAPATALALLPQGVPCDAPRHVYVWLHMYVMLHRTCTCGCLWCSQHGHSRGGHGAWGLATRIPDRVLGVASLCGWYSREEYGDANNVWVHETSLMHADKALLGLLGASIGENDNALHSSTLRGLPAFVRVGSRDEAVPPWFGRRMARVLSEHGARLETDEQPQVVCLDRASGALRSPHCEPSL